MTQTAIPKASLDFLKLLKKNNNRDWFNQHKAEFIIQQEAIAAFAESLLGKLNMHDLIETPSGKKILYRIYRDSRFSADKTPYKTHWSGSFKRATKQRRGGYIFHLEAGNNYIGGGFYGPNPADLKLIRDDIAFDPAPLRAIIQSDSFVNTFGNLKGEQVRTAPKGFAIDHEAIDLLRYKQFLLVKRFTDEEVLSSDFLTEADQTYQNMRPFFDYMSEVLTGDQNGITI